MASDGSLCSIITMPETSLSRIKSGGIQRLYLFTVIVVGFQKILHAARTDGMTAQALEYRFRIAFCFSGVKWPVWKAFIVHKVGRHNKSKLSRGQASTFNAFSVDHQ